MVVSCCVSGCKNRHKKDSTLSFFRVPHKPPDRREKWVKAIRRISPEGDYWQPSKYSRVCGDHFLTGRAHGDRLHPDYVPSQNMGYLRVNRPKTTRRTDNLRRRERRITDEAVKSETAAILLELSSTHKNKVSSVEEPETQPSNVQQHNPLFEEARSHPSDIPIPIMIKQPSDQSSTHQPNIRQPMQSLELSRILQLQSNIHQQMHSREQSRINHFNIRQKMQSSVLPNALNSSTKQENHALHSEKGTQTDPTNQTLVISLLKAKVSHLEREADLIVKEKRRLENKILALQNLQIKLKFTFSNVKSHIKFLTGISLGLFEFFRSKVHEYSSAVLPVEDCLLLVLMRLRLGCTNRDLSIRFDIPKRNVNTIFNDMLDSLHYVSKQLIIWPEQSICRSNIPKPFLPRFSQVISIIDRLEVFICQPINSVARVQAWSNYRKAYTMKFLVSVTPNAAISFISDGRGGMVTDRQLVKESGYLAKLQHGDEILASRTFTIDSQCASFGALVHRPAIAKRRKQLSVEEMTRSREIARLRVRVERVIARMKSFRVLSGTCPTSFVPSLNKIVVIIASFVNMQKSVVKD